MPSRQDRTPRRRLDVEQRRAAILDAARSLYAQRPYSEVTIAQVASVSAASPALVHHYFGSKIGLYTAVVDDSLHSLSVRLREAEAALAPGVSRRDRVSVGIQVYLEHISTHPASWAAPLLGGEEPTEAADIRRAATEEILQGLRRLLEIGSWTRHDYALWGFFGFLDGACLRWVHLGCPDEQRPALMEAALGALEGALGDWGS